MRSVRGSSKAWSVAKSKRRKKPRVLMDCYVDRNGRLSDIGISYKEYLATEEWKSIRARVLSKYPVCLICDAKAMQVHHTDYEWETLLGLQLGSLAALCDVCHERIEYNGDVKRSVSGANDVLMSALKIKWDLQAKRWFKAYASLLRGRYKRQREADRKESTRNSINRRKKGRASYFKKQDAAGKKT